MPSRASAPGWIRRCNESNSATTAKGNENQFTSYDAGGNVLNQVIDTYNGLAPAHEGAAVPFGGSRNGYAANWYQPAYTDYSGYYFRTTWFYPKYDFYYALPY
jgi:hypothetical protein